ncbi:MAG: hypothetical protein GY853_01015 [PVC group bacterium]|nr:hypothetical protein [PVC group bacterium]
MEKKGELKKDYCGTKTNKEIRLIIAVKMIAQIDEIVYNHPEFLSRSALIRFCVEERLPTIKSEVKTYGRNF